MPFYSDDIISELQNRNDIVEVVSSYVQLKQRSGHYAGLCPFHREKSPSFTVSPDKQMFHCFGCGAGGDVIGFIMRIENVGFVDAVKRLAERARMELPEDSGEEGKSQAKLRDKLYEMNRIAARFFHAKLLSDDGAQARVYLGARRVTGQMVKKFGLGYSPGGYTEMCAHFKEQGYTDSDLLKSGLAVTRQSGITDKFRGRLMFPIINAQDKVVGFGGRIMGPGEPKYLNSPDTPVFTKSRNLFCVNYARKTKSQEVIVVEGYMDALALFQAGFCNVAATLGTAFNREHCRVLTQYFRGRTVILLFDSDSAGETAALRALPVLSQQNIPAKVLRIEGAKDPDEFLKDYGADAFNEALKAAKSPTRFRLDITRAKHNIEDNAGMVAYLNDAAAVIASVDDPIEKDVYLTSLAEETGVSAEAIKERAESKSLMGDFIVPSHKPRAKTIPGTSDGVLSACRNVLYRMAAHINFYEAIRDSLPPEEFTVPVYAALAKEIVKIRDSGRIPSPGELAGRFEDLNDQQAVSEVFADIFPYENDDEIKNALNQQIKIIKTAYINMRIDESKTKSDYESLQKWGEIQRNLPNSYI